MMSASTKQTGSGATCSQAWLTVEPGCYIRPGDEVPIALWNIGIRIEDDLLITDTGHEVLTDAAPKTIAAIEELMKS